jgi:hypothetical protein
MLRRVALVVFLYSVLRLLVSLNVVPSSSIIFDDGDDTFLRNVDS